MATDGCIAEDPETDNLLSTLLDTNIRTHKSLHRRCSLASTAVFILIPNPWYNMVSDREHATAESSAQDLQSVQEPQGQISQSKASESPEGGLSACVMLASSFLIVFNTWCVCHRLGPFAQKLMQGWLSKGSPKQLWCLSVLLHLHPVETGKLIRHIVDRHNLGFPHGNRRSRRWSNI